MKIQRAREEQNFTILGNEFLDDPRLSVLAVGLGAILLRLPPETPTTLASIAARRPEGVKALRRAAGELEEAGYLIRTIARGPGGTFTTTTEMHSRPVSPEDRPESLPKPWSKAGKTTDGDSDVSAGRTESPSRKIGQGNFGERKIGDRHSSISTSGISTGGGGEERAGARDDDPSPSGQPEWGASGGRRCAGPTMEAADVIRDVVHATLREGDGGISAEEHQDLAGLLDAARPVVAAIPGLSWDDLTDWLGHDLIRRDGAYKFKSLVGVLRWRLAPEQLNSEFRQWGYERAGQQNDTGPQGRREAPRDPFAGSAPDSGVCGIHRTTLDEQGRCLPCNAETREEERARKAEQQAAGAEADEDPPTGPAPEDLAVAWQESLDAAQGAPQPRPAPEGEEDAPRQRPAVQAAIDRVRSLMDASQGA